MNLATTDKEIMLDIWKKYYKKYKYDRNQLEHINDQDCEKYSLSDKEMIGIINFLDYLYESNIDDSEFDMFVVFYDYSEPNVLNKEYSVENNKLVILGERYNESTERHEPMKCYREDLLKEYDDESYRNIELHSLLIKNFFYKICDKEYIQKLEKTKKEDMKLTNLNENAGLGF